VESYGSPNSVLSEYITNELIMLADARNTTTHIYDQVLAQEVCDSIVSHYQVFGIIIEAIQIQSQGR
jgi:hypothetical protein